MLEKVSKFIRSNFWLLALTALLGLCSTGYCTNDVSSVTQIVDDATTVWAAVSGLIISVVGFLILIRFVRKLR